MNDKKDKPTIAMLLDIEHLYGEHEGRLAPILTTLLLAVLPALFYAYFGLFAYIPIWLFAPINVIIAIRVVLLIPGRENYRLEIFRRRQNSEYASAASLLQLRRIHPDGCVEYINGDIFYAVCCYNGTVEDEMTRTKELRKFLNTLLGDYAVDTYILNVNNTEPLRQYYNKTHKFGKNSAGRNFVRIIDNTVKLTTSESMVQCTVYCIKGKRSDWKVIRTQIDAAIRSSSARCFKTVYRVQSTENLQTIIDMDTDTNVNIDDLLRHKYQTGEFGTSKVLAYDPTEEVVIQAKELLPETPKVTKQAKSTKTGFYVRYSDEAEKPSEEIVKATVKPDYYKPIIIGGIDNGGEEVSETSQAGEKKRIIIEDTKGEEPENSSKRKSVPKRKGRVNK